MNADATGEMLFCRVCGKQIHKSATACPGCGAVQSSSPASATEKRILPAFLLCFFFGWLGVHRFYVGKVGTGVVQMFTFGGFGIWMLIDFTLIVVGEFKDKAGNKLTQWT
jgi:TM2 domain-containing membrane protein YozV